MKYLIDTHTLLWIVANNPKLSIKAKEIYLNSENIIFLSLVSLWEMAIKISLNKLVIDSSLVNFVQNHIKWNDIEILHIELSHILYLEKLPYHHRDPFDRLLICQSLAESIPIISADIIFDNYGIQRVW